jgi:hypothetical protein
VVDDFVVVDSIAEFPFRPTERNVTMSSHNDRLCYETLLNSLDAALTALVLTSVVLCLLHRKSQRAMPDLGLATSHIRLEENGCFNF